jgi:hypothetical protein
MRFGDQSFAALPQSLPRCRSNFFWQCENILPVYSGRSDLLAYCIDYLRR